MNKHQLDPVYRNLRSDGSPVARKRKRGPGSKIRVPATPAGEAMVNLAVIPPDKSRMHLSHREISIALQILKCTINTISMNSGV